MVSLMADLEKRGHKKDLGHGLNSPFHSQDLISNSPPCLTYNSRDASLENLVLDQLAIPLLIFLFILITCLLDNVLIL